MFCLFVICFCLLSWEGLGKNVNFPWKKSILLKIALPLCYLEKATFPEKKVLSYKLFFFLWVPALNVINLLPKAGSLSAGSASFFHILKAGSAGFLHILKAGSDDFIHILKCHLLKAGSAGFIHVLKAGSDGFIHIFSRLVHHQLASSIFSRLVQLVSSIVLVAGSTSWLHPYSPRLVPQAGFFHIIKAGYAGWLLPYSLEVFAKVPK